MISIVRILHGRFGCCRWILRLSSFFTNNKCDAMLNAWEKHAFVSFEREMKKPTERIMHRVRCCINVLLLAVIYRFVLKGTR